MLVQISKGISLHKYLALNTLPESSDGSRILFVLDENDNALQEMMQRHDVQQAEREKTRSGKKKKNAQKTEKTHKTQKTQHKSGKQERDDDDIILDGKDTHKSGKRSLDRSNRSIKF